MTTFAAQPGSCLINADPEVSPIPILGWSKGQDMRAWPVLPMNKKDIVAGEAFFLPDLGVVVDPIWRRIFDSSDSWRAAVEDEEPYALGKAPGHADQPKADDKPKAGRPRKPSDPITVSFPGGSVVVETEAKTFKNKSYWRYDADEGEFVFELPPETNAPKDDRVEKINRDAFFKMRKDLDVGSLGEADNEPEPQEDDGDDGDDLI